MTPEQAILIECVNAMADERDQETDENRLSDEQWADLIDRAIVILGKEWKGFWHPAG